MLDARIRLLIDPPLTGAGLWLARLGVSANAVSLAGLAFGLLMAAMDGAGVNRSREWESMALLSQEVMPAMRRALGR